jgi:hypothetical protein
MASPAEGTKHMKPNLSKGFSYHIVPTASSHRKPRAKDSGIINEQNGIRDTPKSPTSWDKPETVNMQQHTPIKVVSHLLTDEVLPLSGGKPTKKQETIRDTPLISREE